MTQTPSGRRYSPLQLYIHEVAQTPFLERDRELELVKRAQRGDASAAKQLAEAHLNLVVAIARDYDPQDVDILDLIQAGNLGLLKATDRFDPDRDVRFSTYARMWILGLILEELAFQREPIRLPVSIRRKLREIRELRDARFVKLGQRLSTDEAAQELGHSAKALPSDAIEVESLDRPVDDDEDGITLEGMVTKDHLVSSQA